MYLVLGTNFHPNNQNLKAVFTILKSVLNNSDNSDKEISYEKESYTSTRTGYSEC